MDLRQDGPGDEEIPVHAPALLASTAGAGTAGMPMRMDACKGYRPAPMTAK